MFEQHSATLRSRGNETHSSPWSQSSSVFVKPRESKIEEKKLDARLHNQFAEFKFPWGVSKFCLPKGVSEFCSP